eukprot:2985574-Rhodomonas_salina.2
MSRLLQCLESPDLTTKVFILGGQRAVTVHVRIIGFVVDNTARKVLQTRLVLTVGGRIIAKVTRPLARPSAEQ